MIRRHASGCRPFCASPARETGSRAGLGRWRPAFPASRRTGQLRAAASEHRLHGTGDDGPRREPDQRGPVPRARGPAALSSPGNAGAGANRLSMRSRRLPWPISRRLPAFTLIELLVVIAVIAILAGLLFPVFAQARAKARAATCVSNPRQIGMAIQQYVQDWDGGMPEFRQPGTTPRAMAQLPLVRAHSPVSEEPGDPALPGGPGE